MLSCRPGASSMSHSPSPVRVASWYREAKFTVPLRDSRRYFKMFGGYAKTLGRLANIIDKARDNEDFEDWVSESTRGEVDLWIPLKSLQEKLEYLAGMQGNLEVFRDEPGGNKKVLGWAVEAAEYAIDLAERIGPNIVEINKHRPELERQLVVSQYDDLISKQHVKALFELGEVWPKIYRMLLEAPERITASLQGSKAPETEDIETLYHASVDAKTLYRSGFNLSGKGGMGLGGSTDAKNGRPAISFTFDLYIAKEIARTLKEGVLIAQGKVKPSEVLEWADRAGFRGKVIDTARKVLLERDVWDDATKTVEHAMAYWYTYLTYAGRDGKRYNPVFGDNPELLVQKFKKVKYSDIGVLVADVNMSDPDISYHPAEREYRVPAESVVKYKKVIA